MTDDLRRSGSTPEASTSGADVIALAKEAQSVWNRSHTVEIDIVYGPNAVADAYYAAPEIVDGLMAEVERLRGALDRVEALSNRLRVDSESELITSKAVFRAFADEIDSALRGDQ